MKIARSPTSTVLVVGIVFSEWDGGALDWDP